MWGLYLFGFMLEVGSARVQVFSMCVCLHYDTGSRCEIPTDRPTDRHDAHVSCVYNVFEFADGHLPSFESIQHMSYFSFDLHFCRVASRCVVAHSEIG